MKLLTFAIFGILSIPGYAEPSVPSPKAGVGDKSSGSSTTKPALNVKDLAGKLESVFGIFVETRVTSTKRMNYYRTLNYEAGNFDSRDLQDGPTGRTAITGKLKPNAPSKYEAGSPLKFDAAAEEAWKAIWDRINSVAPNVIDVPDVSYKGDKIEHAEFHLYWPTHTLSCDSIQAGPIHTGRKFKA